MFNFRKSKINDRYCKCKYEVVFLVGEKRYKHILFTTKKEAEYFVNNHNKLTINKLT